MDNNNYIINKDANGIELNLQGIAVSYITCDAFSTDIIYKSTSSSLCFIVGGSGNAKMSDGTVYPLSVCTALYIPSEKAASLKSNEGSCLSFYKLDIDSLGSKKLFENIGLTQSKPVSSFSGEILPMLSELCEHAKADSIASNYKSVSCLYDIFSRLATEALPSSERESANRYIEKAISYINAKYYDDINVSSIADMIHINRSYFSVLFKEIMGVTPLEYLTEYRISQSCKLLAMGKTVTEAALLSGFNSPASFGFHFKKHKNMTPYEYKRNLLKDNDSD